MTVTANVTLNSPAISLRALRGELTICVALDAIPGSSQAGAALQNTGLSAAIRRRRTSSLVARASG